MTEEEFLKVVGQRIRALRVKKRMSARKLSVIIDMCQEAIYLIEKGRKDFHILTIRKISIALDVPMYELLPS